MYVHFKAHFTYSAGLTNDLSFDFFGDIKIFCQLFMDNYDIKAMPCHCISPLNH